MKRVITYRMLYERQKRYRVRNVCFTLFLTIIIAVGLFVLHDVLTVYESTQPRYAAGNILNDINNGDRSYFIDSRMQSPYASEPDGMLEENIALAFSGGKASMKEVINPDKNMRSYRIYVDERGIGTINLRQTEKTAKYGFKVWEYDSCPFTAMYIRAENYRVSAPSGCAVTVNGSVLNGDDLVEVIPSEHKQHLPESAPCLDTNVYAFVQKGGEPDVSVTDENGNALTVSLEGKMFTAERDAEEMPEDIAVFAENTMRDMAQFTVGLCDNAVGFRNLELNSNAYDNMYQYSLWGSAKAFAAHMENFELDGYLRIDEHTALCSVKGDYVCSFNSNNDTTYNLNYTFYMSDSSGRWLLYDFTTH